MVTERRGITIGDLFVDAVVTARREEQQLLDAIGVRSLW